MKPTKGFVRKIPLYFILVGNLVTTALFQNCGKEVFETASPKASTGELWPSTETLNSVSLLTLGKTYYVSKTGSDSNIGNTINKPFKTIAKGVAALKPGDTLYLRAGTYTEFINLVRPTNKSGTATAWVTIAGYPGETVIIKPTETREAASGAIIARGRVSYVVFRNLVIDGTNMANKTGWQIRDGNHHFILDKIEIKNQKFNGLLIGAKNIVIKNSKIHSAKSVCGCPHERWYGIYLANGADVIIENTEISNNPGGGMQVYPGPLNNVTIRNNSIHHNNYLLSSPVPGILVQVYLTGSYIRDVQIYNNIIYGNGMNKPSGPGTGGSGGIKIVNGVENVKVWNNTVYQNRSYGVLLTGTYPSVPKNTYLQNNIFYANTLGQIYLANGIGTISTNNLTTDPKFVNASANNFRLTSSSPAVNKGASLSSIFKTDILGVLRPKGSAYDIGAYESY